MDSSVTVPLYHNVSRSACPNHCGDIATDGTVIMADCCRQPHDIALTPGWTEITSKYRSHAISHTRCHDDQQVHCLVVGVGSEGGNKKGRCEYRYLKAMPADHKRHESLSACLSRHVNEISIKPAHDNVATWIQIYYFEDPGHLWTEQRARTACVLLKAELDPRSIDRDTSEAHHAAQDFADEYCRMSGVKRSELCGLHRDAPAMIHTPGSPTRAYRSRCYGGVNVNISPRALSANRPKNIRTEMVRSDIQKVCPQPVTLSSPSFNGEGERKINWYPQQHHQVQHPATLGGVVVRTKSDVFREADLPYATNVSVSTRPTRVPCEEGGSSPASYIVPGMTSPRIATTNPRGVTVPVRVGATRAVGAVESAVHAGVSGVADIASAAVGALRF